MTKHKRTYPLVSYHGGHSVYDGQGNPEKFIEAAIGQGFIAFGFSEHMPIKMWNTYGDPAFAFNADSLRAFDEYVESIVQLKVQYRNELPVLLGVEIDYVPEEETYLVEMLQRYPFDYTVGSVHFVSGIGIDYSEELYSRVAEQCGGIDGLYNEYYRIVRSLLAMGLTDILGHLDIIKIFDGTDSRRTLTDAVLETLEAAREADVILDVNTRGLLKPCHEVYPGNEILRHAQRMGIAATLGDDSHTPDQVGAGFDKAIVAIREAGYRTLTILLPDKGKIARRELIFA